MSVDLKIDELFKKAANTPVEYTFSEAKQHLDSSINASNVALRKGKGGSIVLKTLLIMTVLLSAIMVVWMIFPTAQRMENKQKVEEVDLIEKNDPISSQVSTTLDIKKPIASKQKTMKEVTSREFSPKKVQELLLPERHLIDLIDKKSKSINLGQKWEDAYKFPTLTPDEIAANQKRKEKMLKNLAKLDKKEYAYIPSGTFDYHGSQISLQSFYMQTAEVSNIEYKTFLFDLLINDRKEEFLKAKPDQDQWVKVIGGGMKAMTDSYFSHESYDDYPVVNVSREGAEMYCVWLTIEVRKYQGGKNTNNFNDIRIPVRAEWELAASEAGKNMPFPWTGSFLRNENGCFLANFDSKQYTDFNAPSSDTTTVECLDGALLTARTKTYNPNGYGLYNLSGNVAEMVYENYKSENGRLTKVGPGTAGGGWMSAEEELKINGVDQYGGETNAHPNIGFRVVMTYLNSSK